MKRYIKEIPSTEYVLLGIDHTAWEMKDAVTIIKLNDELTWWQPDKIVEINDSKLGLIRVC